MKFKIALSARRSIRLPDHDYSQIGQYFITICAHDVRHLFGKIESGTVFLNVIGRIALDCWRAIPAHFAHVQLDPFVVMPNHLHGILTIPRAGRRHGSIEDGHGCPVPLQSSTERFQRPTIGSVPTIIRSYKGSVTYLARQLLRRPSLSVWQSNYHERVLRDGKEFAEASRYIFENPMKWQATAHRL
jgi:REP element-mobilizing transposase RayT